MNDCRRASSRGTLPRGAGAKSPKRVPLHATALASFALAASTGCSANTEHQTYDPVALGMVSTDAPLYDDQETTIYQVQRPISLPIAAPTAADLAALAMSQVPPYPRMPWITNSDVKVQVSWTVSNLDTDARNVEILVDPWNEFVRYVPGVNVGEESTIPNLSGIDLLIRVEGQKRASGTFTFDDMDELATDLATVQNIIAANPPPPPPTMGMAAAVDGPNVNGMVNHAFEIHNRSSDGDKLIGSYFPRTVAGLVGFDLGLRTYAAAKVAIEIIVEVRDAKGGRVAADQPLKIDGSMWITPEETLSAPTTAVR